MVRTYFDLADVTDALRTAAISRTTEGNSFWIALVIVRFEQIRLRNTIRHYVDVYALVLIYVVRLVGYFTRLRNPYSHKDEIIAIDSELTSDQSKRPNTER